MHYLKNIEISGKFPGLCDLEIQVSLLENQALRNYYKLETSETSGMLVSNVNIIGASGHLLKINDIITHIDDIPINNDHTVYMNIITSINIKNNKQNLEKIPYWHIIRQKYAGENIKLSIIRNYKNKILNFKIYPMAKKLIPSLSKEISDKYYIFGGLIFMALNLWYLFRSNGTGGLEFDDDKYNLIKYIDEYPTYMDEEIVILSTILQTQLTSGYKYEDIRLLKINDIKILNLKQAHDICISNSDNFVKFEFENNKIIILDNKQAKAQSEQISQQYLRVNHEYI